MKKSFITALVFFIISLNSKAQFQVYSFTQTPGTYSAISGGSVFGTQTTDDEVFVNPTVPQGNGVGTSGPGMPMGFNFIVNGNIYDRVGINANGFIMLGQTTATPSIYSQLSTPFAPISATTNAIANLQYKVVAFGCDIEAQGAFSEIRMETIGTSPNRTMVVQWTNYRKFNSPGDDMNFQIRLCETSNRIEVIYGPFTINGTSGIAQVGIRGNSLIDYSNRYVNAINTWSVSVAGTSNTTTANFNSALVPASGQIYRWTPPPACTTTPASNTVMASLTTICPGGSSTLSLLNTYSLSGITYIWQASTTSSTGPFTQISGAGSTVYYASNIGTNTWYQCAIACSNGGSTIYSAPKQVVTTGASVNQVPYIEDFENILVNNQLPNCSWAATSPSVVCLTYTSANSSNRVANSGSKFGCFRSNTNSFGDAFWSNGVQLYAGITYSASVWYVTDGTNGWTELSLMRSAAQNTTALTLISTVNNPVVTLNNIIYKPLSGTFSVNTSGVYFIAVRCKGPATPLYLSFDDLSVTIPCALNQPSLNATASSASICTGNTVALSVTGANTYTWSGGSTAASYTLMPGTGGVYSVIGTNTLSGCTNTASLSVNVIPAPFVLAYSPSLTVCSGNSVNLYALGADTYTWNNGSTTSLIAVSPTASSIYSVVGTNTLGCSNTASVLVTVLSNPTVNVVVSPSVICAGENSTLTASGAAQFEWHAASLYLMGSIVVAAPQISTTYTVTGKSLNGCETNYTASLLVNTCTGLTENRSAENWKIYPVPCNAVLNIEVDEVNTSNVDVWNASGQIVMHINDCRGKLTLDTRPLSAGLYFISLGNGNRKAFVKQAD